MTTIEANRRKAQEEARQRSEREQKLAAEIEELRKVKANSYSASTTRTQRPVALPSNRRLNKQQPRSSNEPGTKHCALLKSSVKLVGGILSSTS